MRSGFTSDDLKAVFHDGAEALRGLFGTASLHQIRLRFVKM
jgi:hypothetical protein